MLKKKTLYLFIMLPLLILGGMGAYFTVNTWQTYQKHELLQHNFKNAQLLEEYQLLVLDEVFCLSAHSNNKAKCVTKTTKSQAFLSNNFDLSDPTIQPYLAEMSQLKKRLSKYNINNLESLLAQKTFDSLAYSYLKNIDISNLNNEEKVLIQTYMNIANIHYASVIEKLLVTYYVKNHKKEVSTNNLIFWDKIVDASSLSSLDLHEKSQLNRQLNEVLQSKALVGILNKIDDMRIHILTGGLSNNTKHSEWLRVLDIKLRYLKQWKQVLNDRFEILISKYIANDMKLFAWYVFLILLALFGLFCVYKQIQKDKEEDASLFLTLNNIGALTPYTTKEAEVMHEMLEEATTREDIFTYIFSSFHLIYEKFKQAEDEAKSKTNFMSTLSHEIRTPLTSVISFAKLLKEMHTTAEQDELLSLIEHSSQNLSLIVDDILDLSKISADKMEVKNTSFNIFELSECTASLFTLQADQKDIEFGLFIDPFLSKSYWGDAAKISQILTNLIGNAIKFTEPYGKVNVFIQQLHSSQDESKVKFAVYDNGKGLSEEEVKYIFNPYMQASKSDDETHKGTGLGLSLAQQMVSVLGGTLEVESQLNKGSTFYFTLSLQKDKDSNDKPYPRYPDVTVGLALPVKSINRQLDTNLETYVRHLGAQFSIYYYEDLFESHRIIELPDIMIFDHRYARLSGELEQCAEIDCKSVLFTNGTLRSRIDEDKHHFEDILFTPITVSKVIRILNLKNPIDLDNSFDTIDEITAEADSRFKGLKALIADDNIINRKLIKILLEEVGLSVVLAEDGDEVVEKYTEEYFDIIFMDIELPKRDGLEATKSIREYEKEHNISHTPIIAVTSNVNEEDKARYLSEGMDAYAAKPLDLELLRELIVEHCDNINKDDDMKSTDIIDLKIS